MFFISGELNNGNQYMPKMIKEVLAIPGLTGLFVATLFAGDYLSANDREKT